MKGEEIQEELLPENRPGTAWMMTEFIFAVAVLSFTPGGVKVFGVEFNSSGIE